MGQQRLDSHLTQESSLWLICEKAESYRKLQLSLQVGAPTSFESGLDCREAYFPRTRVNHSSVTFVLFMNPTSESANCISISNTRPTHEKNLFACAATRLHTGVWPE